MAIRLRAQPLLDSFLGMDLKLGATLISLFALLNKVAGAYGILAVLLSGGAALSQPVGQLTMYAYSIASLVGFIWGLQKISEENGPKTLLYAHGFAMDHLVGTVYTTFFAVVWYLFVPHDGRRVANSDAQKAMMGGSQSGTEMDEAERTAAAMGVWTSERGFSGAVLLIGWLLKIYFILVLYSFALHLRRGTYSSLPHSSHNTVPSSKFSAGSGSSSSPGSSQRRRFGGAPLTTTTRGGAAHTRASSTGGARYTHLRGASLASSVGGPEAGGAGSGPATMLADSLWEEEEEHEVGGGGGAAAEPVLRSGAGAGPVTAESLAQQQRRAARMDPPESPAFAKGTGMTRSVSGAGVMVNGGGGNGASGAGEALASSATRREDDEAAGGGASNPFSRILGRLSGEVTR